MADYDRGAYTPPTEESFAFDARSPRLNRPVPATLVGSLVVLVVLVGAVALFYWSGVRGAGEGPHVVGKPQLEIKGPPPVDAKPLADGDKLDVYDEEKGQTPPPQAKTAFAPPPEEPQPRPAAQAQAQATNPTPAPPPQVQAQAAPPPAPIRAAPQLRTTTAPAASGAPTRLASAAPARAGPPTPAPAKRSADAVNDLLARNDAPAAKAPKPVKLAAAAPPANAAHGVMVQIGAFSSPEIADAQFAKAKAAFGAYTVGKAKHVERAEVNGKVYYRTAFAGFDRPGAQAFCKALIAAKKDCIVK